MLQSASGARAEGFGNKEVINNISAEVSDVAPDS